MQEVGGGAAHGDHIVGVALGIHGGEQARGFARGGGEHRAHPPAGAGAVVQGEHAARVLRREQREVDGALGHVEQPRVAGSLAPFIHADSSIGQGLIFGMLAFYLAFIVSKQSFKMHNAGFFLLSILFFGLINALVFGILFATLSISLMYVGSILGVSFLEMALAVVITDKLVK